MSNEEKIEELLSIIDSPCIGRECEDCSYKPKGEYCSYVLEHDLVQEILER